MSMTDTTDNPQGGISPANDHILETAARWRREDAGRGLALAVVIATWGSSPRQAGSLMAIRGDGLIAGSVSGGCVEGAVIDAAMRLMEKGAATGTNAQEDRAAASVASASAQKILKFGVADETAWQAGLSCGGAIEVLVAAGDAALPPALLEDAAKAIAARKPVHIDCTIATGAMTAAEADDAIAPNTRDEARGIFRLAVLPAPRLFIIGAGHISQHLAPMARAVGFAVRVIDPRAAFANKARFPDTELIVDWPDTALAAIAPDRETALVTLTHDPKIDDAALLTALPHPLFYIASLGSTRTHAKRRERLTEAGISGKDIDRIHAPAGLDIGATTPAEIAASILAQMVAAYRGKA